MQAMTTKAAALLLCFVTAACSQPAPAPPAESRPSSPPRAGQLSLSALPDIDSAAVLDHIKVLASDEFEGRAPGSKGETRTVDFLTDQFKRLGLAGAAPDG